MKLVAARRDDLLRAQAKPERADKPPTGGRRRADKRRRSRSVLKACEAGVLS